MASNILDFDLNKVVRVENKRSYMTQKSTKMPGAKDLTPYGRKVVIIVDMYNFGRRH